MASVLDLLYSVLVLLVAVGGIAVVYRIGWDERRDAQSPWSLVLAGIAVLFVAAMVLSLV